MWRRFLYVIGMVWGQDCPTSGIDTFVGSGNGPNSWYAALVYCAIQGFSLEEGLASCLTGEDGTGNTPAANANLVSNIYPATPIDCYSCAFDFATAAAGVFVAHPEYVADCWFNFSFWAGTYFSEICQDHLSLAIQAANTCANNGYDFVTGLVDTVGCPIAGLDTFVGSGNGQNSWYAALVYCATSGIVSLDNLAACLSTDETGSLNSPNANSNLVTNLASFPTNCYLCAFEFATLASQIFSTHSEYVVDCWYPDADWQGTMFSWLCQSHLHLAIEGMNVCSDNGYDFVTGLLEPVGCPISGPNTFVGSGSGQNSWYAALVFCAIPGFANIDALTACLVGETGTLNRPNYNANLVANMVSVPAGCYSCAFEFATLAAQIFSVHTDYVGDCWIAASDWLGTVFSSICQAHLYAAIHAMNTCSGNGYDFVTGLPETVECPVNEFIEFSIKYNPVDAIAACAYHMEPNETVLEVVQCVAYFESGKTGSLFPFLSDYYALTCRACFDALVADVMAFASTTCTSLSEGYNFPGCFADLRVAMESYGTCTGGQIFDIAVEGHCNSDDVRILDAMRPYTAVMTCAINARLEPPGRRLEETLEACRRLDGRSLKPRPIGEILTPCMSYYTAVESAVSPECQGYIMDDLLTDVYEDFYSLSACKADFYSVNCTSVLGALYAPLHEFDKLAGVFLNTNSTICSSDDWAQLTDAQTSYIPAIRCAMRSSSVIDTLDCIENAAAPIFGFEIPCISCFKNLAIEAFVTRNSTVDMVCEDPYAENCLNAMVAPLSNFKICSGFDVKDISDDQCSTPDIEKELLSIALTLVNSSVTPTEAISKFNQQVTNPNCVYCYTDLIEDLFGLPDPLICSENWQSWKCYMMGGALLDKFWKCSQGWYLDIVAERSAAFMYHGCLT